jgi:hypothetical protein
MFCTVLHCTHTSQAKLEADLSQEPTDLEQLKFVLNAIAAVANSRMDMELEYLDVMERYRTLKHYEVMLYHISTTQAFNSAVTTSTAASVQ